MTKAGFPVPEGIVLSIDFFETWLSKIKETTEWSELLTEVTKNKCDALKYTDTHSDVYIGIGIGMNVERHSYFLYCSSVVAPFYRYSIYSSG